MTQRYEYLVEQILNDKAQDGSRLKELTAGARSPSAGRR